MRYIFILSTLIFMNVSTAVRAEPAAGTDYILTIKDHKLSPLELSLPANEKVKLTVKNLDPSPAEFESSDLDREKVVGANSEITILIGPLKSGDYKYFDDFHRDTTNGHIIVK